MLSVARNAEVYTLRRATKRWEDTAAESAVGAAGGGDGEGEVRGIAMVRIDAGSTRRMRKCWTGRILRSLLG